MIKDIFLEKNIDTVSQLNMFIDENRGDIIKIVISPEMEWYLGLTDDCKLVHEGINGKPSLYRYKDIKLMVDGYCKTDRISFILKSKSISLNLPCFCGIYHDEKHN